jgi:hypothetical protein
VQCPVDAPVADAGEPVAVLFAGGGVDGGGAVPGGEVVAAGEPGDVTDVADEPGRDGRADAVQPLQCAAGGGDELSERLVGLLDLLVECVPTRSTGCMPCYWTWYPVGRPST